MYTMFCINDISIKLVGENIIQVLSSKITQEEKRKATFKSARNK